MFLGVLGNYCWKSLGLWWRGKGKNVWAVGKCLLWAGKAARLESCLLLELPLEPLLGVGSVPNSGRGYQERFAASQDTPLGKVPHNCPICALLHKSCGGVEPPLLTASREISHCRAVFPKAWDQQSVSVVLSALYSKSVFSHCCTWTLIYTVFKHLYWKADFQRLRTAAAPAEFTEVSWSRGWCEFSSF